MASAKKTTRTAPAVVEEVETPVEDLDISSKNAVNMDELEEGRAEELIASSDAAQYIKTGAKTQLNCKGLDVLTVSGEYDCYDYAFVVKDGVIGFISDWNTWGSHINFKDWNKTEPVGVFCTGSRKTQESQDAELFVILNGDGANNQLVESVKGFPTMSFNCMARLLSTVKETAYSLSMSFLGKAAHAVAVRFAEGSLELVDWIPDETRKLTKNEREKLTRYNKSSTGKDKNGKTLMPSAPIGFSLVDNSWHRSATVVIHDTVADKSYLIGQDEGTYFGVELPEFVSTVDEAFESLIPESIRGIKGLKRQGEWFAVPVQNKQDVPNVSNCACSQNEGVMILPKDDEYSNDHRIFVNGEGYVSTDGKIYVRGASVEHDEHAILDLDDNWYTFVRNTAIRSVSVEGVD